MLSKIIFILSLFVSTILSADSIIAIVNDDIITFGSVNKYIKPDFTKEQKLKIVNEQIDLKLQLQEVKKIGISPKEFTIDTALNSIASQNGLTLKQLKQLKQFDNVVANLTNRLSLNALRQFILKNADIDVSKQEIDSSINKNLMPKNISKQVKIAQIAISSINASSSKKTKDELIEEFLQDLVQKIENGTSFSALAKLHSQDLSYKNGGESEWLDKEKLPKIFKKQINSLKLNELSKPFKTEEGWRIIKVIGNHDMDNNIFEAKSKLIQDKQKEYFDNWVKSLRKDAYIEIFDNKL